MARTAQAELPWMPFFVRDWRTSLKLRRCSRTTRADWIDLLCLMWEEQTAVIRGTCEDLGRLIGCTAAELAASLFELHDKDVAEVRPAPKPIDLDTRSDTRLSTRLEVQTDTRLSTRSDHRLSTEIYTIRSRKMSLILGKKTGKATRQKNYRNKKSDATGDAIGDAAGDAQSDAAGDAAGDAPPLVSEIRDQKDPDCISSVTSENDAVRTPAPKATQQETPPAKPRSPAPPPTPAWNASVFSRTWEQVTHKSGMMAGEILMAGAARVADAARVAGVADVTAFCAELMAALPRVIAYYKRNGMGAPALTLSALLDEKHFSRCEDVVAGRFDPDVDVPAATNRQQRPRSIGRAAPPPNGQSQPAAGVQIAPGVYRLTSEDE